MTETATHCRLRDVSDDKLVDLSAYSALMTVQEVAEVLHLSVDAVRARIRVRELASAKIGHSVRVPRADLERYIAERIVPADRVV